MCLIDSGGWDAITSTSVPGDAPHSSATLVGAIRTPISTRVSDTETMATVELDAAILTRSPSDTPRVWQSSSCMSTVGSEVSRS